MTNRIASHFPNPDDASADPEFLAWWDRTFADTPAHDDVTIKVFASLAWDEARKLGEPRT